MKVLKAETYNYFPNLNDTQLFCFYKLPGDFFKAW